MKSRYQVLHENLNWKTLLKSLHGWIATFDDHDFGINNADRTFPFRNESQDLFWKFASTVDIGRGCYSNKHSHSLISYNDDEIDVLNC